MIFASAILGQIKSPRSLEKKNRCRKEKVQNICKILNKKKIKMYIAILFKDKEFLFEKTIF